MNNFIFNYKWLMQIFLFPRLTFSAFFVKTFPFEASIFPKQAKKKKNLEKIIVKIGVIIPAFMFMI